VQKALNFRSVESARSQLAQIGRFRELSSDIETGALTPTATNLRSLARAFGITVDDKALASAEGLQALAVPFTLQIAQQTKGPISDKEMKLFSGAVPGLARSPLGNEFILEGMERIARRQVEINRLAAQYERENGFLDDGWDRALFAWEEANPLFQPDEVAVMQQAETGVEAPAPPDDSETIQLPGGSTLRVIQNGR
jgi:hypothetical protein